LFSIFGRIFSKNKIDKLNQAEDTAITLNILRTQWKEVKQDRHNLVRRNKTPNTDPVLFQRIEDREKKILERFNELKIDDEALRIANLDE
jgi:hypothetical protein|tara:strand:- start:133 stop:402 length:270 start_codon:yes stop_codon:yes gene_type:complete